MNRNVTQEEENISGRSVIYIISKYNEKKWLTKTLSGEY